MSAPAPNGFRRFLELPPADRELLRERARTFSQPLALPAHESAEGVPGREGSLEVLELQSRGQTFAIPLEVVEGVGELSAIAVAPRAPPLLRGFVSFRGEILFGIDLSALLRTGTTGFADLRRIVVVSAGPRRAAILAERVVTIRTTLASRFSRDRLVQRAFVVGVDAALTTLLDPGELLAHAFASVGGARP